MPQFSCSFPHCRTKWRHHSISAIKHCTIDKVRFDVQQVLADDMLGTRARVRVGVDDPWATATAKVADLKIGAIAPAIARNKWPSAAGSNALAFKCRDSSPIVPTAARGRPRASRARGSDHARERAALCQRPTPACS